MSPLDTTPAVYADCEPAIYENSRKHDIERTVAELRMAFMAENARSDTPFKWQVLACAWASDLSDRDVRQLLGHVLSAKADGSGASRSHQTIAHLSGCCVSASAKSDARLRKAGWITSKQRQRSSSVRTVAIPSDIRASLVMAQPGTATPSSSKSLNRTGVQDKSDSSTFLNGTAVRFGLYQGTSKPCYRTYRDDHRELLYGSYYRGDELTIDLVYGEGGRS